MPPDELYQVWIADNRTVEGFEIIQTSSFEKARDVNELINRAGWKGAGISAVVKAMTMGNRDGEVQVFNNTLLSPYNPQSETENEAGHVHEEIHSQVKADADDPLFFQKLHIMEGYAVFAEELFEKGPGPDSEFGDLAYKAQWVLEKKASGKPVPSDAGCLRTLAASMHISENAACAVVQGTYLSLYGYFESLARAIASYDGKGEYGGPELTEIGRLANRVLALERMEDVYKTLASCHPEGEKYRYESFLNPKTRCIEIGADADVEAVAGGAIARHREIYCQSPA
ncbi:MAG: hypothetical protein V1820_01935 [archaeon]